MKVFGVTSIFLVCVAAKGSGPYLPSGWKPDGPAFYLPSEVSKPLTDLEKDVAFTESEASGSDFLREYGPPKLLEVSQDISQQKLPDIANEHLFFETAVETKGAKEDSNIVTEITEQKLEVNSEVKAVEESLAVTEPQSATATETITNLEEKPVELNIETTTLPNTVDELGYLVEPTVAIVIPTEKISLDVNKELESQTLGNSVIEAEQLTKQEQILDQSAQVIESATLQIKSSPEQSSSDVSQQTEITGVESSGEIITQQADINTDVISAVEEKVDTVKEEVKKVEQVVQNIPELIVGLVNEVKSQQVEAIQEDPAVVQEIVPLDQAPEGFLEYGPPGFREYGPPNGDLKDNTIEQVIEETQLIDNSEARRRRFSPKFRSIKTH